METLSLTTKLREQPKKIWTENVAHATAGKKQCVADRSKPLHPSKATKTKTFKIFHNLTCKSKFTGEKTFGLEL